MTKRPEVPKRLASRLNAVYREVVEAQSSIISSANNSANDRARLAEYERDPHAFARKHYGKHPADSYPVQTNIARCREGLERRALRASSEHQRLAGALERQQLVEREVLEEIEKMRPGTPGRVAWPKPPKSLSKQQKIDERYSAWVDRRWEAERAAEDAEFEAKEAEEERAYELELASERDRLDRLAEQMSEVDRAAFKQRVNASVEAVKSGRLSVSEIAAEWAEMESYAEYLARRSVSGSGS